MTAELALDRDGNFLAVRLTGFGNLGATYGAPGPPTRNAVRNTLGVYKTPLIEVSTKCAFTNTTPIGAYRGAGRPEANYYMERLVETAAAETGIDRVELRRKNHIPPEAMPYKAPNGTTYDSGDFTNLLNKALTLADWDGFAARRAESRAQGRLRGRGISDYLELTGPPGREMGGIRFEPDGTVTIITGTLDYGQGHASPFAQVLSTRLGIPFRKIRLLQGDSDALIAGGGTGGSKSMMTSGKAIVEAGDKVIEKGREIAAHVLEAAAADIEFRAGRFTIAGTDRSVGLMELAEKIRAGLELPPGLPQSLDVQNISDGPPSAFPNGCHIAEVEVDPETGVAEVVRYSVRQRFRHGDQPADGQRPGAWRHRARDRPGLARARDLRRGGPAADRLLHGLHLAAGRGRAALHPRLPSGAGQDQCARRQRVRRGRLRRRAAFGDERARRRAQRIRHPPHRHAGNPGARLARD